MEEKTVEPEDISAWMDNVQVQTSQALPEGKGKSVAVHQHEQMETKFGKRWTMHIVIEGSDSSIINTKLFLPQQFPMIHPKSNLGKIMAYTGCKELRELIGKEVEVEEVGDMLWKRKAE